MPQKSTSGQNKYILVML